MFKRKKQTKGWKDISLRQAIELHQLKDFESDEYLALEIEQLAILLDKDPFELEQETPETIVNLYKEFDFIKQLPKEKCIPKVKLKGSTYALCEFDKLALNQMVDIEEFVSLGLMENSHKILSALFLPVKRNAIGKIIKSKYEPSALQQEAFLDLDMEFVWSNILFFYHIVNLYTLTIQDSLIKKSQTDLMNLMTNL
jgi:hypothetical protein